ncbi:MAG: folate family ECF transporter S component [Oscillospiraceae bacterium]|nr:folate family ECF transporter S component [Oscillospiraceae bacterium]
MRKYYVMVLCGLFVALQVVLGRMLAVDVVFMRVSFIFLPIALGGAIFGPLWNGFICVAADLVGFLLVPGQGPFFPGFTLSAFLTGFAYGYFLKSYIGAALSPPGGPLSTKRSLVIRTFFAAFCVTMLIDAHMNTLWVSILYNKAYVFYYGTRLVKSLAMLPVHVAVFGAIWASLGKYIESAVAPKIAAK